MTFTFCYISIKRSKRSKQSKNPILVYSRAWEGLNFGSIPNEFCNQIEPKRISVDDSSWFNAEPEVECDCCDQIDCYILRVASTDSSMFTCPERNTYEIEFSKYVDITDLVMNLTREEDTIFDRSEVRRYCLSPTGCYSVKSTPSELDYQFSYSAISNNLTHQETCDAVEICGTIIDMNDPRRAVLNGLTKLASLDLSLLNDTSVPETRALCWLLTGDQKYNEYNLCDGTLVQRYILASLYCSQEGAIHFEDFSAKATCD